MSNISWQKASNNTVTLHLCNRTLIQTKVGLIAEWS